MAYYKWRSMTSFLKCNVNIEITIDIIKDISNACMEMVKLKLECGTTKPYFWGDARASPGFHYMTPLHTPWFVKS